MANQEKTNSLNNLKTIHKLQMGGELQEVLRDIRMTRSRMDEFMNELIKVKSVVLSKKKEDEETTKQKIDLPKNDVALDTENKQTEKVEELNNNLDETNKTTALEPKLTVVALDDSKFDPKNSDASTFVSQFNRRENNRNYRQNQGYDSRNNNRPFNREQNGKVQKPINYNTQRVFNNQNNGFNRGGFNNGQRPFLNGNGNRPFNQNGTRQYNQNGQRPFLNRQSNGFAPSKANAFKSFEPLEDSRVLAQPEKTFAGKKAPVKSQYDEKKQMSKKALVKRGFIVDDNYNEDLDGERMGSRKLARGKKKEEKVFVAPAIENAIITTENVSVKTLSEKTGKPVTEIIKKLMLLGIMATINSTIDFTTAELVAEELGVKLEQKIEKTYEEKLQESSSVIGDNAVTRPPVVTVMGHVDHGKTSLLDAIRKTNVVSGEAGGITQKIGAYQITWNGEKITFIDTPGHAAFTSMRARGAKVTDIAILVVAADDGIMPQTIEAINHIKAANCPMIVAINKMDKQGANPERIKEQLAENGVLPEEWGGDTIIVPISAKQGVGIDKLLENVLLVAEIQELKADPNQTAVGTVIEAELDKNRGPIATVLVQNGTLRVGDSVMSGITFGKVRAMYDENGKQIKVAPPSTPVAVLGLDEVPNAGDQVYAVSEKLSKQVIQERINKIKEERANTHPRPFS